MINFCPAGGPITARRALKNVLQSRRVYQSCGRRFFCSPGVTAPGPDIAGAPGNLLVPEPAVRTGALIGYARVSTSGQLLDRQQHALAEAGCLRIFADKLPGKDAGSGPVPECDLRHSGWTGRAQTEPIRPENRHIPRAGRQARRGGRQRSRAFVTHSQAPAL